MNTLTLTIICFFIPFVVPVVLGIAFAIEAHVQTKRTIRYFDAIERQQRQQRQPAAIDPWEEAKAIARWKTANR